MAQAQIVYWRDIPAQVIVRISRREQVKKILDERFEKAIDRAAMKGKMGSSEDYLQEWRKVSVGEVNADEAEAFAENLKTQLEAEFDAEKLQAFVQNGGDEPT